MSPAAELSETEIGERFQITGQRPVAFMLTGFVREQTQFLLRYRGDAFLTTLLAVLPEKNLLIFDCSGSTEANRGFLQSEHSVLSGRPDGIHVQFAIGPATETIYAGSKAFATALPGYLVRLQRRESFRVDIPRARPLEVWGRLFDGALLKLPAHDISVAGICLVAPELPVGLVVGGRLERCHCQLPDDKHELFFAATVQHLTPQEGRSGQHSWRIGLQFRETTPADERRIQRYIDRIERERHELS